MLTLKRLPETYAIWQLPASAAVPPLPAGVFAAVLRSDTEVSGVCPLSDVPVGATSDPGWWCLQFIGPFDLALTGIMVQIAVPLAQAQVPIFTLATYNTDYILVHHTRYADASAAIRAAGHIIEE
ncbi:MAG: hypothetical protein RLY87_367 [Chloroflexota bacterium]|jgi:hypothetical protein